MKDAGSAIDDTFDTITISYDDLGRVDLVKTLKKSDGSVANAVKFEYTALWQVATVWQDVDGDVATSGGTPSPNTAYAYVTAAFDSGNWSRLDEITYPSGQEMLYKYGLPGTSGNDISRLDRIREQVGMTQPNHAIYGYIGLGMTAEVDLAQPDVQLDYQVEHKGLPTDGVYAGFDRFGRVTQQMWVDGGFTTHATSSTVPNIPPIFEQTYSYDKASNRLDAIDARPGAAWTNRDHVYSYDGLHRLSEAQRGVDGGTFAHAPNSQKWSLDMLGNWSEFLEDSTGDGDYLDTGEDEDRTHNDVNELTQRTVGANSFDLAFDDNGNMRENDLTSSTAFRYTHDLWNRLVKVEHVTNPGGSETVVTRGEYEYYGTHWRSIKKADSDLSGGVDELRQQYYTAGWQLIEERIDDAWSSGFTRDRTMQNLYGARYIDDIIMHREDHDGDGDFTDIGSERWWHLTDVQFSTVAIIDDAAVIAERIQYDAYGRAYHHQSNDTDGDGDYDSTDHNAISTASGTNIDDVGYEPDLDVDRDGSITDTDAGLAGTTYSSALSRGELSNATVKNTIGWDGYVFNPEHEMYHVRFRWYSTELGRWVQEDPMKYGDGMNLFQYSRGRPRLYTDPSGLLSDDPLPEVGEVIDTGDGYYQDALLCQGQIRVRHHYKRVGNWWTPWNYYYEYSHAEVIYDNTPTKLGKDEFGCDHFCYCSHDMLESVAFKARESREWAERAWASQANLWLSGIMLVVPGIDDVLLAGGFMVLKGVKFVRIGSQWHKVTDNGLELANDVEPFDIPDEAYTIRGHCSAHNGTPPRNVKGGGKYENSDELLPAGPEYKKYDVYPKPPGGSRVRDHRLVYDCTNDIWYYSPDHYKSFCPLEDFELSIGAPIE